MTGFWVSPTILDWPSTVTGWSDHSTKDWDRAYEHWGHAEALLLGAASEFRRIDLVTTLKRSVDHRLRHLEAVYRFKKLPIAALPAKQLERLEYLGLLRPLLIGKLLDIRNRIEHEDKEPPSLGYCGELVDVVWYFLRSTDPLARKRILDVDLDPTRRMDEPMGISMSIGRAGEWNVRANGWVPHSLASTTWVDGWLEIEADEVKTAADFLLISLDDAKEDWERRQAARDPRDVYFHGPVRGPDTLMLTVYQFLLGIR